MKHLTTEEILSGIRQKEDHILRMIYDETYPGIRKYILTNSGNEQDAEDVFQEAMVLVYRKVTRNELELTSGFGTYLVALCKHLWYNHFRKNKNISFQDINHELLEDISKVYDIPGKEQSARRIIQKHLLQMAPECQQLLMLFYDEVPFEEISQNMGFSSDGYIRKRKFICKKKLMDRLFRDPEFRDLMDLE